ncbi:MAG TPA: hypothetical protein PK659_00190 [Methanothrix sp.]|nr:hypothetical protein [Methanothrix sp.]HOK57485.1 hypothetical protein [Methanothrix sp.]HOL42660.1 hypothetical protein [Methanothrix sp.]HPO87770.1 hypothetical protein [Methanothrix sp.]
MDQLVATVVPIFAAGFAIQQFLEILDPIVVRLIGERDKKLILGIISLIAGLLIAFGTGLRVLAPLCIYSDIQEGYYFDLLDALITAFIISAGTEGINSVMKFLGYAKESKKGDAAALKAWVSRDVDARDIMYRMDRKRER